MASIPDEEGRHPAIRVDCNHLLFHILAACPIIFMIRHIYTFVFVLVSLLITACSNNSKESKEAESSEQSENGGQNDLPTMTVTLLSGDHVDTRTLSGKTMIILFQPDCDHCQREAEEIRERISLFKDYKLYFLSADQPSAVEKFAIDYDLQNQANAFFAITTVEDILRNFGPVAAPLVYIYADRKLVQKFNGETSIEKILQAI